MTPAQLAACTGAPLLRAEQWLPHIEQAMLDHGIIVPKRQAAFLAQIGHESGHLRYVKELWGPTPSQKRYERDFKAAWPPTALDKTNSLAFSLGNSEPGDGIKFLGRGLIQTTGRANMQVCGAGLGLNLIEHPELLETQKYAAASASWFWESRKLNELADLGDFERVTRKINGGLNGYDERFKLWEAAKGALT